MRNYPKILVTGITSIHGWPIWKALNSNQPGDSLMGIAAPKTRIKNPVNTKTICITDKNSLHGIAKSFKPDIIFHCAGVCDLDICQERPNWAYDLNVNGGKAIAEVFGGFNPDIQVYYMSSDLVFSGKGPPLRGYSETDKPDPISVAGETFALAEKAIEKMDNSCIVRLGLPLGDSFNGKKGAVDWIKSRLTKNRPVTLFHNEYRSCVWCYQIEELILALINMNLTGIYHFGGDKAWTLHDIGVYVLKKYRCPEYLLKGIYCHQDIYGPPRIRDISMNCDKIKDLLQENGLKISDFN